MSVPRIDHVVVDVGDRMDEAAHCYRRLGFQLTERAYHSLGSANHLAILDPDYVELLGPGDGKRAELADFPVGLNGLVFAMQDADALHEILRDRGLPVEPVQSFTRGVQLPDGRQGEARFNVVRLTPRSVFDGRVYFCEHLTPEMVWRPEWQTHPNGALGIARVAIASSAPDRIADVFDRMFGSGAVERAGADGQARDDSRQGRDRGMAPRPAGLDPGIRHAECGWPWRPYGGARYSRPLTGRDRKGAALERRAGRGSGRSRFWSSRPRR